MMTHSPWNVEWATSRSTRAQFILEAILNLQPEIVCLTETHLDFLELLGGYLITGGQDWGYQASPTRCKVLLRSREPWEAVIDEGPPQMPPNRFVAGMTNTLVSKLLVYGVCIPWKNAHVRTGGQFKVEAHHLLKTACSIGSVTRHTRGYKACCY